MNLIKGILILAGSGEFTKSMEAIDTFLLSHLSNPIVAIVPTAAGLEDDYYKWITMGERHFQKLGAKTIGIDLIKRNDSENEEILNKINEANFFYFSGGDPGHLLDTIIDTKAWKLIKEKYHQGAILAGSSAGAMVMGEVVLARIYNFYKGIHPPKWEKGLSLVPFGIIPHFDKIGPDLNPHIKEELMDHFPKDAKIIGIDEDTAYINKDGCWLTMGKGTVHIPAFTLNV